MEIQMPFNLTSTLLLFSSFIFLLIKVWNIKGSKNHKNNIQLPPSPPKLPVIGHLHHLVGGLPHRALTRLAQKYGPVLHLYLGEVPAVVISSPEAAKQVLKVHDPACADRPESIIIKIMLYDYSGLFSPYGEFSKQMRKILISEMLSPKNVRSFASIRQDEVSTLIKSLQSSCGQTIDLTENIFAVTSSIVCRTAFGQVLKDRDTLILIMQEGITMAGGFELADIFPSFRLLHLLSWNKHKILRLHRKLDKILDAIVKEHEVKQNGEYGGEDIIDVLLRMKKNEELPIQITANNVKALVFDMFATGTNTTSTTIDWVMAELMRNPRVMAKVQAEVRQAFDRREIAETESHIHTLKYLKMVIKETMRLNPPLPLLPRACREECTVDGYSIQLKTKVMVNIWSLGRDPKYWDEPESFRPERFENNSIDYLGNNFEYLPFGSGRRFCPGMSYGLANVEFTLAQLLYHFDWKLPKGMTPTDVDMTELDGMTIIRKNPLLLVPSAYKNTST